MLSLGIVGTGTIGKTADSIRIGALVDGNGDFAAAAGALARRGLESVQISYWAEVEDRNLAAAAASLSRALEGTDCLCSALGVYGNPLVPGEAGARTLESIRALVEAAPAFRSPIVSCFAGRIPGRSVEDSLPAFVAAFAPVFDRASDLGIIIAFENCRFGDTWKSGKWNIAMGPEAWDLIFDAIPGAPAGLEWEPAHQILALADPVRQLEIWAPRVAHVHAKDATVDRDALAVGGIHGGSRLGGERLAGYGDADWSTIFAILARSGFAGTVDIEIGTIAEWRGPREAEGIDLARSRLQRARAVAQRE